LSLRREWRDAPGQPFAFVIVCPRCKAEHHVAEVDYRLGHRSERRPRS
jgi:hypothetical protein